MNRVAIVGLLLCLNTFSVSAQIQITEIMYDPSGSDTGREWVEVQNTSGSAIDFTTWKFFEADTNHGIASTTVEHTTIEPQEYVIVTTDRNKFLVDFPSFTGKIFKSSFSLSNTGEVLAFKNDTGVVVDQYMYDTALGAAGDGNSLHKGSTWNAALPTPGLGAVGASNASESGGQTNNVTSTTQGVAAITTTEPVTTGSGSTYSVPKLFGTIITPPVAFAGVETALQAEAFISIGKPALNPRFTWNFGDGTIGYGPVARHRYKYPGTYHVVLDVMASVDNNSTSALEHASLIVVAPEISVSVGSDQQGGMYVRIENKTKYLLDVSSWVIRSINDDGQYYIFPKNTFIAPFADMRIPQEITQFRNGIFSEPIKVLFPDMVMVAKYDPNIQVKASVDAFSTTSLARSVPDNKNLAATVSKMTTNTVTKSRKTAPTVVSGSKITQTEPLATTSDTSVSALAAVGASPQGNNSSLLWYVLPLLLITMCGGIFLAIKKEPTVTDGYTIIEDGK